jgi:hypothetical protein
MKSLFFIAFILMINSSNGQNSHLQPLASSTNEIIDLKQILSEIDPTNAGPFSDGRVSCFSVYEKDPWIFYVGSASGGVYKTVDAGNNFAPVFDKYGPLSIGSIAVDQKKSDCVWVGTGESWCRNSVGWGDGIYNTNDGGKTWLHKGLQQSNSIAKIVIHPKNSDVVYVAVAGSPWGYGPDRGVYKTTDGGSTWRKVLYINEKTGAADLAIDPKNPNHLLAAMWDKQRLPYHFRHGGPGSGVYETKSGEIGRISLSFFPQNPKHAAACVEEASPGSGFFVSSNGGSSWVRMPAVHAEWVARRNSQWGRAFYDNTVAYHPTDVNTIYHSIPNHYTKDGGKTWIGATYDSRGIWINPNDTRQMIWGADNGLFEQRTVNGKQSVRKFNIGATGQFYGVGYDMRKPYWLFGNMQDLMSVMFPSQSFSGTAFTDVYSGPGGEGGATIANPLNDHILYGATERGSLYKYDRNNNRTEDIAPLKSFGYVENAYTIDTSYQRYLNSKDCIRVGWNYGFAISPHNSNVLYYGANFLFKSIDQGKNWTKVSPDLTHNRINWQVPAKKYGGDGDNIDLIFQTISTIGTSVLDSNIIWIGTDDGKIQLTLNGGNSWSDLTAHINKVPPNTWVSHIEASKFSKGKAFITFDGHRNFNHKTYVYTTNDYGKTWIDISSDLPENLSCLTIKEGIKNPDLLYLGTEFGLYISIDRGKHWIRYETGDFPSMVSVNDLQIHPRDLDLIIGTHGRSIWIIPVGVLEELIDLKAMQPVHLFTPYPAYAYAFEQRPPDNFGYPNMYDPSHYWAPNKRACISIPFYISSLKKDSAFISVIGSDNKIIEKGRFIQVHTGLNVTEWDEHYRYHLVSGDYTIKLIVDDMIYKGTLKVEKADEFPNLPNVSTK